MTESAKRDFGDKKSELVQLAEKVVEEFKNTTEVGMVRFLTNADANARAWMENEDAFIKALDVVEEHAQKVLDGVEKALPDVHEDLKRNEMEQVVFSFRFMQGCVLSIAKQMHQKESGEFAGSLKGEYLKTDVDRAKKLFRALEESENIVIGRTPPSEGSTSFLQERADTPHEERSGFVEYADFLRDGADSQVYEAAQSTPG